MASWLVVAALMAVAYCMYARTSDIDACMAYSIHSNARVSLLNTLTSSSDEL